MEETKKCKHCQSDIPKKSTVCPVCKKKQLSKLKVFLICLAVFFAIGIVGSLSNDSSDSSSSSTTAQKQSTSTSTKETTVQQQEEVIEYTAITVEQLDNDLKDNALKATDSYKGKYLEITGKLSNIDSSGKYISLSNDEILDVYGVHCYIKSDEQKQKVMDMKIDEHYTIRVKIKDVGEVIGYSADIIEFVD